MSDVTPGQEQAGGAQGTGAPATVEALPELPTVECLHCGQVVPEGHFCGSCGAHLLHWSKGRRPPDGCTRTRHSPTSPCTG